MAIPAGKHFGPYEILSQLGAGGMGEVYKARDTRLDRIVAIKVLPAQLSDRRELRERFEREARAIAGLKHPHICVLYDIGRQDGTDYLVMEYLEGESLAERLQKGPLPLEQALRHAIEIADALDAAHRQGFTHRDIKPANVMLTKDGTKLLDFGLAKLKQQAVKLPEIGPDDPTPPPGPPVDKLTVQGTFIGTVQYMSPEQVEGKNDDIDGRSDIFSFGATVYEMLTAKKAFEGKSQASVMSKIMQVDPPPISTLDPPGKTLPPAMDYVVKTCLAKDPDERWQTATDLRRELKRIRDGGGQAGTVDAAEFAAERLAAESLAAKAALLETSVARGRKQARIAWAVAAVLAIIVGIAAWMLKPSPAPARPVTRLVMALPAVEQVTGSGNSSVALSRDGTHLAYAAVRGGSQQIYLRAMESFEEKPVPGTEGGDGPFFSPDGQWLGFLAGGKLKKVAIGGGAPQVLCDAATLRGASWGDNDTIVFAQNFSSGIWRVSADGGKPEQITSPLKTEYGHRWPELLPGGKAVIFTSGYAGDYDDAQIVLQRLDTGERRVLIQGGTGPHYVPTGQLVFARAGTIMAAPFDLGRLEVTGAPVSMVEGVSESTGSGKADFSISGAGSLVYLPGDIRDTMVWVDREGVEQPLAMPPRPYSFPTLSPDGQRLAVAIEGDKLDIWVYDIRQATLTRLTFEGGNYTRWTPDGKRVTFSSSRSGQYNLFWKLADGSGAEERLTKSDSTQVPSSWSSDGQFLASTEINPATGIDIWVLPLQGDRKARPFLQTPFNETGPVFSPDGHWLAYWSDESGRDEIYAQPFPGPGGKRQISTEGGTEPVWARNGRELFYRNGRKMMAVDIATQPTLAVGSPRPLFEGRYTTTTSIAGYDVTADGQRFLMVKPMVQEQAWTQINVVLNWFEELKKKVPVK